MELKQTANKKYAPLFTENWWRYAILIGGRSAGRSTAASQRTKAKLASDEYYRCALMRLVLGDVRNSNFQELIDRIDEQDARDFFDIRESPNLVIGCGDNFAKGMGFRKSSGDQKSKLKSLASYNEVHIEEADEISQEDFQQLDDSLRTMKGEIHLVLTLNPPDKNHWIVKRFFNLLPSGIEGFYKLELKDMYKDSVLFIHTTYRDNIANISPTTVANFERYKLTNPDHYYNMIEGLVSEGARGRVFKNWTPCTLAEFEELPYPSYYGLDFGFSNDPTALVEIKQHNENIWCRELIYENGLTNQRIAARFDELGVDRSAIIYADSAEPKSIAEIRLEGWNVVPTVKGADSIKAGVDYLLERNLQYTEESANIANEQQEYRWALDANKEPTNKPIDAFNHAIDAIRGATKTHNSKSFVGFV